MDALSLASGFILGPHVRELEVRERRERERERV